MIFFDEEKKRKIIIIVEIGLLIIIVFLLLFNFFKKNKKDVVSNDVAIEMKEEEVKEEIKEEKKEYVPKDIRVDIKGAVKKTGVYTLKEGSIINDLIEMAGGVKSGGTLKNINLSRKLEDQMVIYVYTTAELNKLKTDSNEVITECKTNNINISNCEGSSVVVKDNSQTNNNVSSSEPEMKNEKININTASLSQLMSLSGIGEAKAKSIIEYREANGLFNTIEDIKNVKGIGDAMFEAIKESITV